MHPFICDLCEYTIALFIFYEFMPVSSIYTLFACHNLFCSIFTFKIRDWLENIEKWHLRYICFIYLYIIRVDMYLCILYLFFGKLDAFIKRNIVVTILPSFQIYLPHSHEIVRFTSHFMHFSHT